MKLEPVHDPDDPRVAAYRDLRDGARLAERGEFVAESRHVVRRLLTDGRFAPRSLLLTPAALSALEPHLARLAPGTPVYVAPRELLSALAGYRVHQGCLARVARGRPLAPSEVLEPARVAAAPLVVLERLASPDNVGGVFRNAHGFGAAGVWLAPGGCDPLYRKAIRASAGATLRVPFARQPDWPAGLASLRAAGLRVLACTARAGARDLRTLVGPLRPARVALLFGTEDDGLSPAALRHADEEVTVATVPGFDSLNVATASGVVLHHFSAVPCAS